MQLCEGALRLRLISHAPHPWLLPLPPLLPAGRVAARGLGRGHGVQRRRGGGGHWQQQRAGEGRRQQQRAEDGGRCVAGAPLPALQQRVTRRPPLLGPQSVRLSASPSSASASCRRVRAVRLTRLLPHPRPALPPPLPLLPPPPPPLQVTGTGPRSRRHWRGAPSGRPRRARRWSGSGRRRCASASRRRRRPAASHRAGAWCASLPTATASSATCCPSAPSRTRRCTPPAR